MRPLRIVAGAVAGLLLLAVLAAWLAPLVLDWNHYRAAIAQLASTSLGRPVQIAGPIGLTLLPHPVLTASHVTLPDRGDGSSAEVAELRLQVGLGSLLTGRLEAEDLTLHGAEMRLAWPLRPGALQQNPPDWLTGLHGRVEDGTLLVGGMAISDIAGTLAVDPVTGTVLVDALAAGFGRRWRVTARLGRAGGDGSAPLEASLDGVDAMADTGATFSGQLAPDGALTGRVAGRGRDLSQVMAAPAEPWHAVGRFHGADGLALADDMDVEVGGVPARAAVALRLLPQARLDVALAASRLDLARWLPNLLHGAAVTIPTSVDLSAEAATLAGGTLRHVRFAFDLAKDGVGLRDAEAILPGDANAMLSGHFAGDRFTGAGRIDAANLRETLAWLQPGALAALPPDVLQTASLAASVVVVGGRVTLDGLTGTLDGNAATGAVTLLPGAHPELDATLTLADLNVDRWAPRLPADLPGLDTVLTGWPGRWAGLNGALVVSATHPHWRGATLDRLDLDAGLQSGTLTLRRAALTGPGFSVTLAGALAPGGHLADGRFDGALDHASLLVPYLPPDWPAGLFKGQATLHAAAAGSPGALGLTLQAGVADLRLDAAGTLDLARPAWQGSVELQHPGAPRLLEALGAPGVASWLGDGSFSLRTALTLDPHFVALGGFTLSAGALRMGGDVRLDRGAAPVLTGRLDAETLPLPLPYIRSPEPLPTASLRGWRAQLDVKAAHVLFGLSPALDQAAASVTLADGAVHVSGLAAEVAGGKLTGGLDLDVAGLPHLAMHGSLTGATLSGPLLDGAIDVTGGQLDATADLRASGFGPGALLATIAGTARAAVTNGVLTGMDLAGVESALGLADAAAVPAAVTAALQSGSTAFTRLTTDLTIDRGAVALRGGALTAPSGQAAFSGLVDLPIDATDLMVTLSPARVGAPAIGLRLIGPAATPRRTPELAALTGWLASR